MNVIEFQRLLHRDYADYGSMVDWVELQPNDWLELRQELHDVFNVSVPFADREYYELGVPSMKVCGVTVIAVEAYDARTG